MKYKVGDKVKVVGALKDAPEEFSSYIGRNATITKIEPWKNEEFTKVFLDLTGLYWFKIAEIEPMKVRYTRLAEKMFKGYKEGDWWVYE